MLWETYPKRIAEFRKECLHFQDDCVGDKDKGAKSWSTSSSSGTSGQQDEGGWTSYLLPMFLAAVAAYVYRTYFA